MGANARSPFCLMRTLSLAKLSMLITSTLSASLMAKSRKADNLLLSYKMGTQGTLA